MKTLKRVNYLVLQSNLMYLVYRHECFTGKYTTCKIHMKLHLDLKWHILHILTSEDIDDFTDIKFVSYIVLKLMDVWSKNLRVFLKGLQKSSEILRKCSAMFVWPLEQFWKSSEIFGNGQKSSENDQKRHHLTSECNKRVRYCSCQSNIKLISSRHCVISSTYTTCLCSSTIE